MLLLNNTAFKYFNRICSVFSSPSVYATKLFFYLVFVQQVKQTCRPKIKDKNNLQKNSPHKYYENLCVNYKVS